MVQCVHDVYCISFFILDKSLFNFKAIFSLLLIPQVFYLIGVKTLVGIPAGIFHSMFSVVNMERFDLTPEMNGYILTYIGILTAVSLYSLCVCVYTSYYWHAMHVNNDLNTLYMYMYIHVHVHVYTLYMYIHIHIHVHVHVSFS